jgi:hypothetical protein
MAELRRIEWVVYAKRPFAGPAQVLAYLGRYTHRVAISNTRLVKLDGDQVSFRWRDYRHHDKRKVMTLAATEFIRRFLLHALPDGFQRIRHYGFSPTAARRRRACRRCSPCRRQRRHQLHRRTTVSAIASSPMRARDLPMLRRWMEPFGLLPRPARSTSQAIMTL